MNGFVQRILGSVMLAVLATVSVVGAPQSPNSDCLECHGQKDLSKTNAAGKTISLFVDQARYAKSVHATNTCTSCHSDLLPTHPDDNAAAKRVNCALCHKEQTETYRGSVHSLGVKGAQTESATCVDCHGKHDILSRASPDSPLYFTRLAATCGECHPEINEQVQQSVHGKSVARGHREAATCIDCHSEHKIEDLRNTTPVKISEEVCSKCHASERINTKFRLPADRVKTFMESYHGLASHLGSMRAANCGSCHGTHLILPSNDPRSSIYATNLVATCGKCHPGASENFAQGKVHLDVDTGKDLGSKVNLWVRRGYLVLIFGTIGLMFAHNFLAWRRRALAAYYAADRTVIRMDLQHRVQHVILALSFIILALTGFALKYPDSWLSFLMGADENFRRLTHRAAGVIMLVLGGYHVLYVAFTQNGRQLVRDLMPRRSDWHDLVTHVRHLLSHGKPRARFGRFGYAEKMEYWAVAWGTVIMGVTGLAIWFKIGVTQFLPRWAVDVATTIHYYEAILACLAILVWHFYFVLFDPEVYPINWAWWDGRVSAKWHQHEHPLDTSATDTGHPTKPIARQKAASTAPPSPDSNPPSPAPPA